MATCAMLTLDLDNKVPGDKRSDFYDRLEKDRYFKIPNVTTAWEATFSYDDIARIQRQIIREVRKHARAAGIARFEAAAQVGNSKVFLFDQELPVLESQQALHS